MHRPGPVRSELGLLTPLYPISGFVHAPVREESPGVADAMHFPGESGTGASWERRCMRKHRRSPSNEGSSPKRRRLMGEVGSPLWDVPGHKRWPGWAPPLPVSENRLAYPGPPAATALSQTGGLRTEVEAAQRRLQEIEERITLEDDDEDEDLEVEPAQNRPVLVMSQSLREGLQQGLGDILPQNVAESVSRSCMELVVWRPPGGGASPEAEGLLAEAAEAGQRQGGAPAVGPAPAAAQASGSAPAGCTVAPPACPLAPPTLVYTAAPPRGLY
ncbi:hypothetical protein ANANG_G00187620 [Anguilla anguilla]|uniref:Coiled-coil domain-containing protein 117 n=1 Tax=Anguilla anguilla TaxID=7936 RepID=A0A9D3RSE3_ANGAN|nr:hypothetical protein ANANG_G00187620 [Anguilla anguilla]